jgi:hypothetical protein
LEAFADESESDVRHDPETYLLAAAVAAIEDVATVRDALLRLLLKGQRKLHWRDEDDKRRLQIIEIVAALPLRHVVVGPVLPKLRPAAR